MPWGKPKRGGWSATAADEPVNRFSQIIRTIISVVPGGVIRSGKDGPDDDTHVGFWLGVTTAGVARFSVGGPAFWLKWDGTQLLVRGKISTLSGDNPDDRVHWVGVDGEDVAYLQATDAWGHQLEIGILRQDSAGDPGMLDLFVDGDFAAGLRLRLYTERGAGQAGTKLEVLVGNMSKFWIDGFGNVYAAGVVECADAVGAGDAVNRGFGDGRYVAQSAGWSGSFRTDEIATVTVVNGQITAVA